MRRTRPGNVRELQNVIERAVILTDGPVLELNSKLLGETVAPRSGSLADAEREHIQRVLHDTRGMVAGAANILGLPPKRLRDRMKRLGISARPESKSER